MSSPFAVTLGALVRQRGVVGCMVVGESDGIIVDGDVQPGVDGAAVAALAASLYRKARLAAEAAGLGAVSFLQLEAEDGHLCAVGRDGLVLVAVAEARTQIGLLRAAMLRQLGALA